MNGVTGPSVDLPMALRCDVAGRAHCATVSPGRQADGDDGTYRDDGRSLGLLDKDNGVADDVGWRVRAFICLPTAKGTSRVFMVICSIFTMSWRMRSDGVRAYLTCCRRRAG